MHPHSSERMHRLSVVYAMVGLFFGCLSAGLIVASLRPVSRTVVDSAWMEHVGPASIVMMETRGLREHRRLTDEIANEKPTKFGRNLKQTIAPFSPTTSPSPTSAPTPEVMDINEPTIQVSSGGSSTTSIVTTETVAAAMVGVASSIIVCALLMYASDVRNRYRHEKWAKEQRLQDIVDDGSSQPSAKRSRSEGESRTSAGSTHEESDYWVQVTSNELVEYQGGKNPQNILPPFLADEEREESYLALTLPERASISRVSSMTASYLEGGYSYADFEEKFSGHAIESSSDVTVLSDAHRVSDDTALSSLIKGDGFDASVCSSLTNGSSCGTALLFGEECHDIKFHQTTPLTFLQVSPDKPFVGADGVKIHDDTGELSGEKSIDEKDELTQLEQIIAGIPFDEISIGTQTDVSSEKIIDEKDELTQLEQLIAGIPFDEMSIGTQTDADTHEEPEERIGRDVFVRDVCFVPCAAEGKMSLGLECFDATSANSHPTVLKVDLSGPLVGRVFIGDAILAVNDKDTSGLGSEEIMELFESKDSTSEHATKMIKLTVMSLEVDGGSLSDGQQSVDLDSAVEI